jgi:hypothetical protein
MIEDISEHAFPANGGWLFRQVQTGWTNPMAMVGFKASVQAIIKHRNANPAIKTKHQLATDYEVVANELKAYTRLRLGIPEPPPASFFPSGRSPSSPSGEADAAATTNWYRRVARLGTGVRTLADWLGEGGHAVAQDLAEQRAATCDGCPQNKSGDLLSFFTEPVVRILRKQLQEREDLKLSTKLDDKLNICDACGCPLKLKVHVPLEFIKKHMKQPEHDRLDPRCWILREF